MTQGNLPRQGRRLTALMLCTFSGMRRIIPWRVVLAVGWAILPAAAAIARPPYVPEPGPCWVLEGDEARYESVCDDGNPCTFDYCNPLSGCVHVPDYEGMVCAGEPADWPYECKEYRCDNGVGYSISRRACGAMTSTSVPQTKAVPADIASENCATATMTTLVPTMIAIGKSGACIRTTTIPAATATSVP